MAGRTDTFAFTWHIEHFDMCPLKEGEYLRSPTFKASTLQNTKWHLRVFPRGQGRFPSAHLFREGEPEIVTVGHNLSIITDFEDVSENGVTRTISQCESTRFRSDEGTASDGFAGLASLFDRENAILVRGSLVVRCCLWPAVLARDTRESSSGTEKGEHSDFPVVSWSSCFPSPSGRQLFGERSHWCAAHTRIPWHRRIVNWTLEDFGSLEVGRTVHRPTSTDAFEVEPEFGVSLQVLGFTDDHIRLRFGVRVTEDPLWLAFAKLELFVYDDDGFVFTVYEDEHFFERVDESWSFPLLVETRSNGVRDSVLTRNGQLVLRFVFSVSHKRVERCSSYLGVEEGLKGRLRHLYETGKFCDVTIRTQDDRTFPVHKNVLCARSDVFCAMFENDTRERNTGIVDMADMDPDTLDKMLDFMYNDKLGSVTQEDALKLFTAADKYQVLSLKKMCASFLVAGMSVSSVCGVLELAELHQDGALKDSVVDFICANAKEVLSTSSWTKLMESNSRLAGEIMHHILVKKL